MRSLSTPNEWGEGGTEGLTSEKNRPEDQTELVLVACNLQVFFTVTVLNSGGGGEGTGDGGGGHPRGDGREGGMVWVGELSRGEGTWGFMSVFQRLTYIPRLEERRQTSMWLRRGKKRREKEEYLRDNRWASKSHPPSGTCDSPPIPASKPSKGDDERRVRTVQTVEASFATCSRSADHVMFP